MKLETECNIEFKNLLSEDEKVVRNALEALSLVKTLYANQRAIKDINKKKLSLIVKNFLKIIPGKIIY